MTTHSKVANVIEEDNASGMKRIDGIAQESPDNDL
jgi:hypothetical protein